jgi:hypothetical protein
MIITAAEKEKMNIFPETLMFLISKHLYLMLQREVAASAYFAN